MPQLRCSNHERIKSLVVCKDWFAISYADRDEIDDRLVPTQPYGNARRMSHSIRMAGGAPALQSKQCRHADERARSPDEAGEWDVASGWGELV